MAVFLTLIVHVIVVDGRCADNAGGGAAADGADDKVDDGDNDDPDSRRCKRLL